MNDTKSHAQPSTDPVAKPAQPKFNFWRFFWLSFLVVSLSWAFYDFYVPANKVIWAKDYASAQQLAAQSGKPIILFVSATWCVPCRIMKREVWADEQVEAVVKAGFTPVMVDFNDPKAAATLSKYQVYSTPTTIITDALGYVLTRSEVGMSKAVFLDMLGKLSKR